MSQNDFITVNLTANIILYVGHKSKLTSMAISKSLKDDYSSRKNGT